ncbi:MAG: hypothetical protein QXE98_02285 [Archaeoglobaceae archaeon]
MGMDLDRAIEEKVSGKRKTDERIKELIGERREKDMRGKSLKACFVISQKTNDIIDAMSLVERREKSSIINEAIEQLFRERIKKYSPITIAFLKERYPGLFEEES